MSIHHLSIDLETYSSVDIGKAGLYKYVQSPDFQILLFAYSLDGAPVQVTDLASGEALPEWLDFALRSDQYTKHAYNAAFEWYWAQVFLLDGGERLGHTLGGFRERFLTPDKRNAQQIFSYKPKAGAADAVQQLIGDICVSMKAEDYLQLPECVSVTVPVELDAKARNAYNQLECEMLLEVDGENITAESAAVLTQKLLQLAGGAVYDGQHEAKPVHGCKVEALLELVEALQGQHALVFYAFVHEKERLLAALKKSGLRVREFRGSQDADDWNAGEIDLLLAHPASTAYGLNLQQGGSHVIWFGLTWSLELYQQANARLHRQGQQNRVIVHHLATCGSVDEDVLAALEGKADTQEALLQSLKARIDNARRNA